MYKVTYLQHVIKYAFLYMNSSYANLHMSYSYGQDMHNFRQNDMSNFLGWLAKILRLYHFTLTETSDFERIRTKMKHLKDNDFFIFFLIW